MFISYNIIASIIIIIIIIMINMILLKSIFTLIVSIRQYSPPRGRSPTCPRASGRHT